MRRLLLAPLGLLMLMGLTTLGVLAAAQLKVYPAMQVLQAAAGSVNTPTTEPLETPTAARGIMYAVDERVVNLADKGAPRYLKARIVVEIAPHGQKTKALMDPETYKRKQEELHAELSDRAPVIDDLVTMILSSKTTGELLTPDGKLRTKEELRSRLSEVLAEHHVLNVYFTQFVIQ